MNQPQIVDCGDGPKIAGTRITVYTILEYLRAGRARDWIAATLNLSSGQVQTAIDYIRDHEFRVTTDYDEILARIARGNSPNVKSQLQTNRAKVKARLAQHATTVQ
jgi:uncharacterized protein (DUF433 family)